MKKIEITWIGHSCFKITKNGYTIVFDPTEDNYVPGISPIREEANMVFCSHEHGDHNARGCITIKEEGTCPFIITRLESYHDDKEGELRGENIITIIQDDDIKLVHFGDQGCMPNKEQLEELMNLDVALVPVGGYYTIDAKEAKAIIDAINPKIVIPMHFRDDNRGFGFDVISSVDSFAELFSNVEYMDSYNLNIEDTDFKDTKVIVLKPKNN